MSAVLEEFFRVGVYKRSQGRITRQVTFAALVLTMMAGLWRLVFFLRAIDGCPSWVCYGIPAVAAVIGFWLSYRAVNLPAFADFLIAVEAEMNKVSWPSRNELFRSSIVVILTIFALGFLLAAFDVFWKLVFRLIGI